MNKAFIIIVSIIFLFGAKNVLAAGTCGGDVVCACGDTVTSSYVLPANLDCRGISPSGLVVGADGITIDGGINTKYTITGGSPYTLSDTTYNGISDSGHYNNLIIKNLTLSGFTNGVYLASSTGSTIQNIDASLNRRGIYLYDNSTSNLITDNNLNSNQYGVVFGLSSFANDLVENTVSSNQYGVYDLSGSSFTGNTLFNNIYDLYNLGLDNTFSSNRFLNNANSEALELTTSVAGTKKVGDTINFTVSAFLHDGVTACTGCLTISLSPSESSLAYTADGNDVTGSFIPTRSGTYSLTAKVTDSNDDVTEKRIIFLIGDDVDSQTTKYYLRGTSVTHGQGYGNGGDFKSLTLSVPTSIEEWECSEWIQNSPDDIPEYPMSNLSSIDVSSWYKARDGFGSIGVQRLITYVGATDANSSVPQTDYHFGDPDETDYYYWINRNFADLNWTMNYPQSWYWLSLKLLRTTSPHWTTFPVEADANPADWAIRHHLDGTTDASYADFTYSYTNTPAIKSISNTNVNVLSATSPVSDTSNASIVLNYPFADSASSNIVLGDPTNGHSYRRPFQGYTTIINSDGTATLQATGITSASSTINSVPLDITPNAGTISVSAIATSSADDGATYYPSQWTENGTSATSAVHTIDNLKADTYYVIAATNTTADHINGTDCVNGDCLSTADGKITFTYDGGYSEHVFSIVVDDNPPTPANGASIISTGSRPGGFSRLAVVQPAISPVSVASTTSTSTVFVADRTFGNVGNDVKLLQNYLNTHGFVVAVKGNGSLGHETTYFGPATRAALIKFQKAKGIKPAVGYFGPITRGYINTH